MRAKLGLLILIVAAILTSRTAYAQGPPDCQFSATFTSTTALPASGFQNSTTPCVAWRLTYYAQDLSAASIQIEGAPDSGGSPGAFVIIPNMPCSSNAPPCMSQGTNPLTDASSQTSVALSYYPWIRLSVTVFTPSGPNPKITARVYGYKGTSAQNGSGSGSGNVSGGPFALNDVVTGAGGQQIQDSGILIGSLVQNPMIAAGDLIGGTTAGAPTRITGNTSTTFKVLAETGDGVNAPVASFQTIPLQSNSAYYFTNTASDIATYLQMTTSPYSPKTTLNYPGQSGTGTVTLQNWATNAGVPGVTFIPAGEYELHVHATRTNAFSGSIQIQCQFVEVNSLGVDIAVIGTSEPSTVLTQSEVEYNLVFADGNVYTLASSSSRIVARVQAVNTAIGLASTATLFVGGTADSHITIPSAGGSGGSGYSTIESNGTPQTQRTILNMTGTGVSCVDNSGNVSTDCTVSAPIAGVPYTQTVSGLLTLTIPEATHNRGTLATAACFDNATPPNVVACQYSRDSSGNFIFTWSPAFTGTVDILANGGGVTSNNLIRSIGASFDGGGTALSSGKTAYFTVPFACTIAAWNITVDTGTATIDVWRVASGTAIPTVANTITASATPAISSGTAVHSTVTTGWCGTGTCAVAANDIFGINLKTVASATLASLVLQCNQ